MSFFFSQKHNCRKLGCWLECGKTAYCFFWFIQFKKIPPLPALHPNIGIRIPRMELKSRSLLYYNLALKIVGEERENSWFKFVTKFKLFLGLNCFYFPIEFAFTLSMLVCVNHSVLSHSLWPHGLLPTPPMEFSRQEYRSGLPFPSPGDLPYYSLISASLCLLFT